MFKISRLLIANFCSRKFSSFLQFAEVELLDQVLHEFLQFPTQRVGLEEVRNPQIRNRVTKPSYAK